MEDDDILNTYRRFGETGPVYQVLAVHGENGKAVAKIVLPESGEQATVAVENVRKDPRVE